MKLSCGNVNNPYAQMAALSVRIILDFDTAREVARDYEETLVKSYMRIVGTGGPLRVLGSLVN